MTSRTHGQTLSMAPSTERTGSRSEPGRGSGLASCRLSFFARELRERQRPELCAVALLLRPRLPSAQKLNANAPGPFWRCALELVLDFVRFPEGLFRGEWERAAPRPDDCIANQSCEWD